MIGRGARRPKPAARRGREGSHRRGRATAPRRPLRVVTARSRAEPFRDWFSRPRPSLGFGRAHSGGSDQPQGALTFNFAIRARYFGLDRRDIIDPWYEFAVVGAGKRRVRMQTGFFVERGARPGEARTGGHIVVPGSVQPGRRAVRCVEGLSRRRARPWSEARVALHRCLRPGGRGSARRSTGDDSLDVHGAPPAALSAHPSRPGRPLCRRRPGPDVGGNRGGNRPLPACRRPRSRARSCGHRLPSPRDAAVPFGRPGAVRRRADRA